jgi:hypothetical protein
MTDYYSLPLEIVLLIAECSYITCYALVKADPRLSRNGLTPDRIVDMFTKVINGKYTLSNGMRHRGGDLPAVDTSKKQIWYYFGKIHRDGDQPAVITAAGSRIWYQYCQTHRDGDKPAVITSTGDMAWVQNGLLHRDGDQPAVVRANGYQEWFQRGLVHRDGDRPAVIMGMIREWYRHGRPYRDGRLLTFMFGDMDNYWPMAGKYGELQIL